MPAVPGRLLAPLSLLAIALVTPALGDPLTESMRTFERQQMQRLAEQQHRPEARIGAFNSDGCSGGLSATWQGLAQSLPGFAASFGDLPPWEHCCNAHDRHYWLGDTVRGYERRLAADAELRACVIDTGSTEADRLARQLGVSVDEVDAAFALIAEAMFQAVRLGGAPCTRLPWRWGHGWPECDYEPEDLLPDDLLTMDWYGPAPMNPGSDHARFRGR